jgi:hypothetical protein
MPSNAGLRARLGKMHRVLSAMLSRDGGCNL